MYNFDNLTINVKANNIILFKILYLSRTLQNMKKITVILMIFLISISPLFRGLFFEYETYGFMAALALLCILYFFTIIYNKETIRINKLYLMVSLLMLAGICFSFANAMNARATLRSLLFYMELTVVFIVLYDYFYGRKQQFMKAVMLPSVVVGAVAGFIGAIALVDRLNFLNVYIEGNRIGSTLQYANTAAVYFLVCFIFAVSLANSLKNVWLRSVVAGLGSVSLFAFLLTGSRGGLAVGIIACIALLVIQPAGMRVKALAGIACPSAAVFAVTNKFNAAVATKDGLGAIKWIAISFVAAAAAYCVIALILKATVEKIRISLSGKMKFISAAIVVVVLLAGILLWKEFIRFLPPVMVRRLERLANQGVGDANVLYRLEFFRDAFKLLASHWLFGLGGDGWKAMYHSVQDFGYTANYVHNHFLQVFVDHGVLSFLAFTGLTVISGLGFLHSYLSEREDRLLKSWTAGMLCGYAALVMHSAFDFDLTFASMALLLWTMFAVSAAGDGDVAVRDQKAPVLGFAFRDRWRGVFSGNLLKVAFSAICALLLSVHALWFTAAYNAQKAYNYKREKNYGYAMIYYEEANRLDPSNTGYTFELAKLYHYFGKKAEDRDARKMWLEKARRAGEMSVNGNKNYPAHMNTLARIYIDSGMPLEALDMSLELLSLFRYDAETYEVLAKSYIDAALYYEEKGDVAKARELLASCVAIDNNPDLRMSVIESIKQVGSPEVLASYRHSDKLAQYLEEARKHLARLNK